MKNKANRISWRQRRGYETIDLNDTLVLVQAPVEQVVQALNQLQQVVYWERDIYEREIVIQSNSLLVFQFQGHPWTVIRELRSMSYGVFLQEEDTQSLSSLLCTKAIFYHVSDTAFNIGYYLYNCGESIEELFFTSECEEGLNEDEEDEETYQGTYRFQSQLRQLEAKDIKNPYNFVHDFLLEQDVYIPIFFSRYTFEIGEHLTLQMEGVERNDLERMDYIVMHKYC